MFGIDSDRHDPDNTIKSFRDALGHSVSSVILTSDTGVLDEYRLKRYSEIWLQRFPEAQVLISGRDLAMERARQLGTDVLVTGSLFLVAHVLRNLNQPCT